MRLKTFGAVHVYNELFVRVVGKQVGCSLECDDSPRPRNTSGCLETLEVTASHEDRQDGGKEGRKEAKEGDCICNCRVTVYISGCSEGSARCK